MAQKGSESTYRLKQDIKKAEQRRKETYMALGVRVYNLIKEGKINLEELEVPVREIDSIAEEIATKEIAIEKIKKEKKAARGTMCPHCGVQAAPRAKFCPNCGKDMKGPVAEPGTPVCPRCNKEIDEGDVFCGHCGKKLLKKK